MGGVDLHEVEDLRVPMRMPNRISNTSAGTRELRQGRNGHEQDAQNEAAKIM